MNLRLLVLVRVLVRVLVLVPVLVPVLVRAQSERARIVVSAAISLTDALNEIKKEYAKGGGGDVQFNFAGSNVLARQIVNGAPVDVFISADQAQMDVVARAGAIDPRSRRNLLANRLVIVTPKRFNVSIANPRALLDARIARIAVGDPAAVPAGVYARAYLEADGIWKAVQPKLVPLANVRAALEAVGSEAANAAIVYETDVTASTDVQLAYVFPENPSLRIVYPVAITSRSGNRTAAERFVTYLQGDQARRIFERFKFRPAAN